MSDSPSSPVGSVAPPAVLAGLSPAKWLSTLPQIVSSLLLLAGACSILSTLALLGYLVASDLASAPQQDSGALYSVGILGLLAAEVLLLLAVVTLLVYWFARGDVKREPHELIILVVALIPYMVLVIAFIVVIIYLWERRQDGAVPQTHGATNEFNQRAAATFVDAGAITRNTVAGMLPAHIAQETLGTPQPATASPALHNAMQQVVGPATGNGLSHATGGLLAFTIVALLFSVLATVGIVVPSKGLDPVLGAHNSSATSLTGTWTLFESNFKTTCDPADFCSFLSRKSDRSSSTVVIQQNGTHLIMATPNASQSGGIDLDTLTGTVIGKTVDLSTSYHGPYSSQGTTVDLSVTFHMTGTVDSINQLSGKFHFNASERGSSQGQEFVKTEDGTEDIVVTRIIP